MFLLDARNGSAFDLPRPDAPTRTFVVASLPRTGSTLLCNALWDTGLVGAPKEYLNPMQVRDFEVRYGSFLSRSYHLPLVGPAVGLAGRSSWPDARLAAYLERIRRHRTGPSGWFGLKVHWHHFDRWFLAAGRDPLTWLTPERWVLVTRADHTRQAISWARAVRTNRWAAWQRPVLPPVLDRRSIESRRKAIVAGEAGWHAYLGSIACTPLHVTYEELVTDWEDTVRRVLRFLDVPDELVPVLPAPSLTPQADALTEQWVARISNGR